MLQLPTAASAQRFLCPGATHVGASCADTHAVCCADTPPQVIKNHFASEYIYNKYKDLKTCDIIEDNPQVRR